MSLRGPSGKFSLANFGRKASGTGGNDGPSNGFAHESPDSPTRETGSNSLDGFGKKLGKSLAHNSLLPGLGNKEQRTLQE
jgi:hypothetical protein